MKTKILLFVCALSTIIVSCRREFESSNPEVIREWYVPFSSQFTNPAVAGRPDTGTVHIQLLENNSIRYDFKLTNFRADDLITGVSLNAGSPIASGPVLVNLNSRLGNKYITGVAQNLRQSLVDSLRDSTNQIYFTANSSLAPSGIFRGQLNERITLAGTVPLSGSEEVPPVTTTARGTAIIRVTSNRKVYSLVTVTNVETADRLSAAHIHTGARGQNGPIIVNLVNNAAEFGVGRTVSISDATYNLLMNNSLYVNVHSVTNPAGKIRGQLK